MTNWYRLNKPTPAISISADAPTTVSIPGGSIVTIVGSDSADSRFTEVTWGDQHLRVFDRDLKEAGEPVRVRRFNAAGREIGAG